MKLRNYPKLEKSRILRVSSANPNLNVLPLQGFCQCVESSFGMAENGNAADDPAAAIRNPLDTHVELGASGATRNPKPKKRISFGALDAKPGDTNPPPLQRVHDIGKNSHHNLWGSVARPGGSSDEDDIGAINATSNCCCVLS